MEPTEFQTVSGPLRTFPYWSPGGEPGSRRCGRSCVRGLTLCRPHSFMVASSHHQRPSRSCCPGSTDRVHGSHPMDTKPCTPTARQPGRRPGVAQPTRGSVPHRQAADDTAEQG